MTQLTFKPVMNVIQQSQIIPTTLNRSKSVEIFFYNRVPKCASSTLLFLIRSLMEPNNFSFEDGPFNHYANSIYEETLLLQKLYGYTYYLRVVCALPFLYILPNIFRYKEARGFHSHTYFINFDQYGVDESIQPTLINMIRKPVSMQVSRIFWDYYLEHGQDPEKLKQNFNLTQCLIRNQYYCRFQATQLQICFFAGSGPPCSHVKIEDGEVNEVLQLAKYNVERHYAVVGLTERLNETLVLLEAYLPRFFRGISAIYKESDGIAINVRPFEAAASQLEQNLIRDHPMIRMELDFYDFVKQRFDKQFAYISGAYKTPLLMKIWGYIFLLSCYCILCENSLSTSVTQMTQILCHTDMDPDAAGWKTRKKVPKSPFSSRELFERVFILIARVKPVTFKLFERLWPPTLWGAQISNLHNPILETQKKPQRQLCLDRTKQVRYLTKATKINLSMNDIFDKNTNKSTR